MEVDGVRYDMVGRHYVERCASSCPQCRQRNGRRGVTRGRLQNQSLRIGADARQLGFNLFDVACVGQRQSAARPADPRRALPSTAASYRRTTAPKAAWPLRARHGPEAGARTPDRMPGTISASNEIYTPWAESPLRTPTILPLRAESSGVGVQVSIAIAPCADARIGTEW